MYSFIWIMCWNTPPPSSSKISFFFFANYLRTSSQVTSFRNVYCTFHHDPEERKFWLAIHVFIYIYTQNAQDALIEIRNLQMFIILYQCNEWSKTVILASLPAALPLLLINLNRAHWQLEIPFKVELWRFLSPYDVDTLTHNKLPLFITGPCKSANPLKKF